MPNYRPTTTRAETFEDRCLKGAAFDMLKTWGEDLLVDGKKERLIFKIRAENSDGGFLEVKNQVIEIKWPTCADTSVMCGSKIVRKGIIYEVKTEPEQLFNGWTSAEVSQCGQC